VANSQRIKVHPENASSIRLAERLGEVCEGEVEWFGNQYLLYRIYKSNLIAS